MSEWKDSYESRDDHLRGLADVENERLRLLKLDREDAEAERRLHKIKHDEQVRLQKLNMGICIYRDFGRDQEKWPAWIRAKAAELGIE